MGKFFVKTNQINNSVINIIGDDVNHIKNVLRLNVGDRIDICNSESSQNYICEIKNIFSKEIECIIIEELETSTEGNVELHIFQGLPKSDKMELVIQKGTELGAKEFIPVSFKRSIVKLTGKDEAKKIDRWNKISEIASKQCGRDIIPKVRNIESIKDICNQINDYDIVLVAYELEKENYIKKEMQKIKGTKDKYKIAIVIGPEGGIEPEEINVLKESGAKIISLGKRILRTETVAMQVSSIIMYELEESGGSYIGKS